MFHSFKEKREVLEAYDSFDTISDTTVADNADQEGLNLDLPPFSQARGHRLESEASAIPHQSAGISANDVSGKLHWNDLANERAEAGARTPSGSDPHEASHSTAQKSADPPEDNPTHSEIPGHTSTTALAAQYEIVVIEDVEPENTGKSATSNVFNHAKHIPPELIATPKPVIGRKRKRGAAIEPHSNDHCIFKACNIFFLPNNDADMGRRIRITRAIEHGATWVKHWHPNISHVVIEKPLTIKDLLKFIGLKSLPTNIIIVNDNYTVDCVSSKSRLDPQQPQYYAKGAFERKLPSWSACAESEPTRTSRQIEPTSRLKHAGPSDSSGRFQMSSVEPESDGERVENLSVTGKSGRMGANLTDKIADVKSKRTARVEDNLDSKTFNWGEDFLNISDDHISSAIAEARLTAHLPLEFENVDESSHHPSPHDKIPRWQHNFACMRRESDLSRAGPNAATIDLLQQMADYYQKVNEEWRTRAYRLAIASLKSHTEEITTASEAIKLPNIGSRIAEKIEEIARTSRLRRLENTELDPTDQALKTFLGIYGVGWQQAQVWVRQGYRTLQDLRTWGIKLSKTQEIGLAHYDDFNSRIPRDEITKLGAIVDKELKRIDENFETIIGGSYRRGARDSGDIDIMITHPTNTIQNTNTVVSSILVPRLTKQKFLTAALAVTSSANGTKWHGACVLPSTLPAHLENAAGVHRPWRRIDLLLVPHDELGAALIYFTGNDIFNRSMRLLARKKGMRLNQRGLYKDVIRDQRGEKMNEGAKIAGKAEEEIFDALGVPWREASERDC